MNTRDGIKIKEYCKSMDYLPFNYSCKGRWSDIINLEGVNIEKSSASSVVLCLLGEMGSFPTSHDFSGITT
jgi:hypothetical protein